MRKKFKSGRVTEDVPRRMHIARREFIRVAAGAGGALLAGQYIGCSTGSQSPRKGLGNLFMEGDKPILVAVEGTDFKRMLEAGLDALGGLKKLVAGKNVVLKPNVVASQPPPVTTDPEALAVVAEFARTAGAGLLTACDSNSSGVSKAGKFEDTGYPAHLKRTGVALDAVDFGDRMAHVFVSKDSWQANSTIGVAKTLQQADVIINLPMVKRHSAARFTCALKNHFGSVYGPLRFVAHNKMESGGDAGKALFDTTLAEFADAVRPELNIVDARALLIRSGPSLSGKAEVKPGVNRIILCGDMVATDAYCSRLMQEFDDTFSPDMISFQLETAVKLGLGQNDLNKVVIKEITV